MAKENELKSKKKKANKSKGKFSLYTTLLMYALLPMIIAGVCITFFLINRSASAIKEVTSDYLYSVAVSEGKGLENYAKTMGNFQALSQEVLTERFSNESIKGLETGYCYVADASGNMLYHPTSDKIGRPVSNSVIQGVCKQMANQETIEPDCVVYRYEGKQKFAAYYVAEDYSFVLVISADYTDVDEFIKPMYVNGIGILVGLILVFTIIAIFMAKLIATPLKKVSDITNEIADGNLNVELNIKSNIFETIALIDATNKLKNSFSNAVGTVIRNATSLDSAVIDVDGKTAINASSSNQINDAIGEVADTSQAVAESAQKMNDIADELEKSIDGLVDNVENLKNSSDEIRKTNGEANHYMQTVMDSSKESVSAVKVISERITETNEAVSRIDECVQMIENIASQTNLLSLNASIEAARAGEAGRGFAVVAEEIRKLADDSQMSAGEIKDIISQVIVISETTVSEAKKVFEIIEEEQNYISETQQKFTALSDAVDVSIDEISNIKDMSVSLGTIKNNIISGISDLGAMSEELGASAQEVAARCGEVAEACADTQTKTEEMRKIGVDLGDAISVFRI